MADYLPRIRQNLAEVRERIAAAAAHSGRPADRITLVAVTKYADPPLARAMVHAGCDLLGENRPQALWEKAQALADLPVRWHLIGHLQRNKVRRTLPLVSMIQSVDSPRLLEAVDRVAGQLARRVPVLLEVNISGEPAKHGVAPEELEPLLAELPRYGHVEVRGLMAMAGLAGGRDRARRDFAALRRLRDQGQGRCPDGVALEELSMGMSGDFDVAVEEGATIVRIGSALLEGVER